MLDLGQVELWQQSAVEAIDLALDDGELRTSNPFSVLGNLESSDLQLSSLGGCGSRSVGSSLAHCSREQKILGLMRWSAGGFEAATLRF